MFLPKIYSDHNELFKMINIGFGGRRLVQRKKGKYFVTNHIFNFIYYLKFGAFYIIDKVPLSF